MIVQKLRREFDVEDDITISDSKIEIRSENLTRSIEAKTGFFLDAIYLVFGQFLSLEIASICCEYTAFGETQYIYFPVMLSQNEIDKIISV